MMIFLKILSKGTVLKEKINSVLNKRNFYFKIKYKIKLPLIHYLASLILFRFPIFLILFDETNSQLIAMFKSCLLHSVLCKKILQKSNLILPFLIFFKKIYNDSFKRPKPGFLGCDLATSQSSSIPVFGQSLPPPLFPTHTLRSTKAGLSLFAGKVIISDSMTYRKRTRMRRARCLLEAPSIKGPLKSSGIKTNILMQYFKNLNQCKKFIINKNKNLK